MAHSLSSQNMKEYNENAFLERNRGEKLKNVGPRGPWSSVSGKLNLGLSGCTCRLPPPGTNAMQNPKFWLKQELIQSLSDLSQIIVV